MHPVLHRTLKRNLIEGAGARKAGSNIAYALGDSRTTQMLAIAVSWASIGFGATWAKDIAFQAFDLPIANINGGSGETSVTISGARFTSALASSAKMLFLLAGVNDPFGAVSAANSQAALTTMCNGWVNSAADRVVFVLDEMPWTTDQASTQGQKDQHTALRNHIRSLHNPALGIYCVPSWQACTGGDDSFVPLVGWYKDGDGLHPGVFGAYRMGALLASTMAGHYPPFDYTTRTRVLGGPLVGASLAAAGITVNGTVVSTAMETVDGINWVKVVFNTSTSPILIYPTSNSLGGVLTANVSNVDAAIRVRVEAGSDNVAGIALNQTKNSLTAFGGGDLIGPGSGTYYGDLPPDAMDFRLNTPVALLPVDATGYRWLVSINCRRIAAVNQTMSATVRVAIPEVYAV